MSAKYDQSILQTQTGCKLIELIIELGEEMKMWKNEYSKMIDAADPYIVEDGDYKFLQKKIKMLKNDHHKALNCVTGNKGKSYMMARKYMKSEELRDRYKTSD